MKRWRAARNGPVALALVGLLALLVPLALMVSAAGSAAKGDQGPLDDLRDLTGLPAGTLKALHARLDDWNAIVRRAPIYAALVERMAAMGDEKRFVLKTIEQGFDPVDALSAVDYLLARSIPLSELPGVMAGRSLGKGWDAVLDPVRARYGLAETNPFSKDEIRAFLADGLTPEDIVEALGLAEASGSGARDLLGERLAGKGWDELAASCDPEGKSASQKAAAIGSEEQRLLDLGYDLPQIRQAQVLGRALGVDAESLLAETGPDRPVQQVSADRGARAKKARDRAAVKGLEEKYGATEDAMARWTSLGLNPHEIENVLRLAREKGADPEAVVQQRLAGTGWEEILAAFDAGEAAAP